MVEAGGESEYSGLLKTQNLLKNRDAKNAQSSKMALYWNVAGTRDFRLSAGLWSKKLRSPLAACFCTMICGIVTHIFHLDSVRRDQLHARMSLGRSGLL